MISLPDFMFSWKKGCFSANAVVGRFGSENRQIEILKEKCIQISIVS